MIDVMNKSSYDIRRVLVVEDEPSVGDVFRRVLRPQGFEVDIAVNGVVALRMVEEKHYDHCLIDIRTPEMNGMEFYMWLQDRQPELADQVIFTSGDIIDEETQAFLKKSSQPFLSKPFTPEELVRKTREAWKRR